MTATTTTRKQLRSLGLSHYLAREVTRHLTPSQRNGRAYNYLIQDVVASMKGHASKIRVKPHTRKTLEAASSRLLAVIDNCIPVAFGESTDSELSQLAKRALLQMQKTDCTLAALKLDTAEILADFASNNLH
ncbi:MAG: hypothetical protein AAF268_04240 [Cyanobacteria bacterium P01_A01_bin.3]